jgi:ferric-dicitrate binding protein FerR (iron transport regulator)
MRIEKPEARSQKPEAGSTETWRPGRGRRFILLATGFWLLASVFAGAARGEMERLWMMWNEGRADVGRTNLRVDTTKAWSTARVLEGRVEVRKTPTASAPEMIPMPVEPGSRVGSVEVPAESVSQIVRPTLN